jgi:hypothetical protein
MNACWPMEISPAWPASRFHMVEMVSRMNTLTKSEVSPVERISGMKPSSTSAPATTPKSHADRRAERRTS